MKGRAALALAALVAPWSAAAEPLIWIGAKLPNTANDPWPWWVDGRARAASLPTAAQTETVFNAVYQTWGAVSCSFMSFTGRGQVQVGPAAGDGKNLMATFVQTKTQDNQMYDFGLGGGVAIAGAMPLMYNGVIEDCDIVINAVDWQWSASGVSDPTKFDLQSVGLHEVGHCLGLDHYTGDVRAVMYPSGVPGEIKHQLSAHEVDNLCQLYPKTGGVGSSCETVACTSGLTCVTDPATNKKFCSRACNPSSPDCPTGFWCKAGTNPSPGACFAGNPPSVAGIGAPCADSGVCGAGGVCFTATDKWPGGYCSQQCTGAGGTPCPAQSACYDDACNANGCFCLKDCRPGYGDCRQSYTCEPLTGGRGRCRPACATSADCGGATCRTCDGLCLRGGNPNAKVGDGCTRQEDCAEGSFCLLERIASAFKGGYCTAACYTACTTCAAGSACLPYGISGEKMCLKTCGSPADCRAGYACALAGATRACQPSCQRDLDCPVGDRCIGGSCVLDVSTDGGSPGADGGGGGDGGAFNTPGCTCGAAVAPALAAPALVALAAAMRRRRGAAAGRLPVA